jgi:stalled ribosome rescue protein Dom34
MSYFVIWTDKQHSKTFEFTSAGVKGHHFVKKTHEGHTHTHDAHHAHDDQNKYFKELASQIHHAKEILILGSGVGKNQFAHYLETHHPHDLFPKVVGVETLEEITDPQIMAFAKKYFTVHHDFWHVT